MQASGRGGFPHRRGFPPRRAGKVHPAWAPVPPAFVVGAPAVGVLPDYAAARPRRTGSARTSSGRRPARRCSTCPVVPPAGMTNCGRTPACGGHCWLYRRLRQLWDNAAKPAYLSAGCALAQAAHPDETPPLVVDPFAGGDSIPLLWKPCGWAATPSPAISTRLPASSPKRCWRTFPGAGRNWSTNCAQPAPKSRRKPRRS